MMMDIKHKAMRIRALSTARNRDDKLNDLKETTTKTFKSQEKKITHVCE